jgi:hypothetical protein
MTDLLQIAAFFLRRGRWLWCKKRGPPWKKCLNSSRRDIDFPTTLVKYSATSTPVVYQHIEIERFFSEFGKRKSEFSAMLKLQGSPAGVNHA